MTNQTEIEKIRKLIEVNNIQGFTKSVLEIYIKSLKEKK